MKSMNDLFGMEHSNNIQLTLIAELQKTNEIKTLVNTINDLNMDINNFYKVKGKLYPYCYIKDTVIVEIYNETEEYFINFHVKEMINQRHKEHDRCVKNNNYSRLFCLIDKPFRFKFYKKLFNQIPDEQKYEVFKDIYISSEYGFNALSKDFIKEIFKYNNSNKDWFAEDVVTIYRGETDKSTHYDEACSWTTDIKVARWFANRFDSNGKVYKGCIIQKDILDYNNDRNEKEILALPENIFDIEEI